MKLMTHHGPGDEAQAIPQPVTPLRKLFAVTGIGPRWPSALRLAAAFALPASIAEALGQGEHVFGIMAGIWLAMYGHTCPYRMRWRLLGMLGGLFLAWVCLGEIVAWESGGARPVLVVLLVCMAAMATYIGIALPLTPPLGAWAVMFGDVGFVGVAGGESAVGVLVWAAIGMLGSLAVSMPGRLYDRDKPQRDAVAAAVSAVDRYRKLKPDGGRTELTARRDANAALAAAWAALHDAGPVRADDPLPAELLGANRRMVETASTATNFGSNYVPLSRPPLTHRLTRALSPNSLAMITTVRVIVAGAIAAAVSSSLRLDRPDWTILTVALVVGTGLARMDGTIRGLHRLVGTLLGIGVYAAVAYLSPSAFGLIAVLAILLFLIDFLAGGNYALAVAFITPAALLVGAGGDVVGDHLATLIRDRVLETAIGALVGIAALWLIDRRAHRRRWLWQQQAVATAAARLLELLRDIPPDDPRALRRRRDLQYELLAAVDGGMDAAYTEPAWAQQHWLVYLRLEQQGYGLLTACWTTPPGDLLDDVDDWAARLQPTPGDDPRAR
ncbi:FUSC family protein [Nocardia sp. NPDC049149]|uniref:FUSC family protein n=1 Tax=Nocardia sp. NPDC049149 TaxID=3364315 RepID=UPI003721EA0C